jgi:hypothetical protein
VPRRSSRRYRRRHPPRRGSTRDRLGLSGAGRLPRALRWGLTAGVVALLLALVDTRSGLLRRGRSPDAALLVDALLLGVAVVAYILVLRHTSRAHDRRR